MKKLYIIASVIFFLLPFGKAGMGFLNAQNVYIPDPVFKQLLVGTPTINTTGDGEITFTEAAAYTGNLYAAGYGIYDLTGIEAFTSLNGLDCSDGCFSNNLTSLDVSSNTALTYLNCGGNYLTSLDLSANTSLTLLECSSNFLTSLDLSNNTALTVVYCYSNQLTSLNLPAGTSLTNLQCPDNQLTSLDVSANPALTYLYCYFNQLTCLDLSANPALTTLNCTYNQLTGLNMQNGNNAIIPSFNFLATNNPNLSCIQVDDVTYSGTNWSSGIDVTSSFSLSCGIPSAFFTTSAPVCFGNSVVFDDQSFPVSFWLWDFGDGNTSTLPNPLHTYAAPGNYIVTLMASNCYGSSTISETISQGSDIFGHAGYPGGNVTNGFALLYPYQSVYTSFDTVQIQPLDALGNYQFTNISQGEYLIKIFPDTLDYPTLISTYSSSDLAWGWAWDSAAVIMHGCVFHDTADVVMYELPTPGTGFGLLHGLIIEGIGFGRAQGDPVHGVDVKLGIAGSSTIVASTQTDTVTGGYTFTDVPFGVYTIYVDIPGLERDSSYTITVDGTNNQFVNLNYLVDSSAIYILLNIGLEDISSTDNKLNIYPNPVKGNSIIQYSLTSNSNVKLDVYNLLGIKVQSLVNTQQESGEYLCNFNPQNSSLKSGVYFISLSVNGKINTMRIVVME